MKRISKDQWMIEMAVAASKRASCLRASVGCVAFDEHGRVLATGCNSPPKQFTNCSPTCPGQHKQDYCLAVHAEISMLIQCAQPDSIHTVATTLAPCWRCGKALLDTGMKRLIYIDAKPEYYGYCDVLFKNIEVTRYERAV